MMPDARHHAATSLLSVVLVLLASACSDASTAPAGDQSRSSVPAASVPSAAIVASSIGSTAPAGIVAEDQFGNPFAFADHAGQFMVLQFCTLWCGPCQQQGLAKQAIVEAVVARLGSSPFVFQSVVLEDASGNPASAPHAAAWAEFILGDPALPVLHPGGGADPALKAFFESFADAQGTLRLPTTVVVGPDLVVLDTILGFGSAESFGGRLADIYLAAQAAPDPATAVGTLRSDVLALPLEPAGLKHALAGHLETVLDHLAAGRLAPAANVLAAFANQADALAGTQLDAATTAALAARAREIGASLVP